MITEGEINDEIKLSPTSPFAHLYKTLGEVDQNKRRQELLSEQKRRREAQIDTARGLDDIEDFLDEKSNPERETKKCEAQVENARGAIGNTSKKKFYKYSNKLMFSEWLIDVPADFDVSWYMKICPTGSRNILVAKNCQTMAFSKYGILRKVFESALPNGRRDPNCRKATETVLDCIWNRKTNTYYVLDVIVWASRKLTLCDTEFRFFWLQSRMSELSQFETMSGEKLVLIPSIECNYSSIKEKLEVYPCYENDEPSVDGLLFYHKEANYTSGSTPLVGWLKPFMVPEILNLPVCSEYLEKRPKKYVNLKNHIEYAEKQRLERKNLKKMNVEMEIA